jgi:uncharacterized cupin superfamily protein/predicted enzyme related to lactoylglutathione lyase
MDAGPVAEAKLEPSEHGLMPAGEGWFVVNAADAFAMGMADDLYAVLFEAPLGSFPQLGINLRVLGPGRPAAAYHAESGQEAYLVLQGRAVLIVEEQERRLGPWDFVHLPPWTAHTLIAAGEEPCVVLMAGARTPERGVRYPVSETAARHGVSVAAETSDFRQALAALGVGMPRPGRFPWPPARGAAAGPIRGVDFITVPARELGAAVRFYGETLGLACSVHMPERAYAEFEAGQLTLSVVEAERFPFGYHPNVNPIALHVCDVEQARAELGARGVEFQGETFDTGVCHMAFFSDPDGNALMLHHRYAPRAPHPPG